jgi:hypothetical protein
MKLMKVHRVLTFNQKAWLKPYIEFNTMKRQQAKNKFEKDFYKLMSNYIYGKTMEDVRKHRDIKMKTSEKSAQFLVNKPTFSDRRIINEDLIMIEMDKSSVLLNKPIATGVSILDLSKVHMYNFHYNTIKEKYGNDAKLLFTDTDSLCYSIETDDLYEDMKDMSDLFDTSEYPETHPLYSKKNKKVLGKFKDECVAKPMLEFCGIRSKMYSFIMPDKKEKKTAKGVKTSVMKTDMHHQDYLDCILGNRKQQFVNMNTIRSYNQQLFTISQNKVSLCAFDSKRYYIDSINSYAYGHKNIKYVDQEVNEL